MVKFMKVSKVCGTNSGCLSSAPLIDFEGDEILENYDESRDGYSFVLADN